MTTDGRATVRDPGDLRLDLRLHGRGRVPGRRGPVFDLTGFVRAREHRDLGARVAWYAEDADIHVVDPASPPPGSRTVHGRPAIRAWFDSLDAAGGLVTDLVDGGDVVAFTERWTRRDGTSVVAASTAEVRDGLVAVQRTVLAWGGASTADPSDGWTRLGKDLWTTAG
ncbi:nuclear transport factor 2 family protein [Microlunatus antarcticus]|uniref:SnoaL-like domain-containing protein n=1 Tax=Microlunatus antarcticus TaxID=53388 RepID=A0A7W5P6X7_9ACTN|nr:nuclear transport factor 2 family protein [Microlunatus antarcticus]MBB3326903.1 hypothetical protein [Microlunatus antarcticus]